MILNNVYYFTVSDFISDHRVLHASLQCIRPHPVRKQIAVRALRRIKDDALADDLDKLNVDQLIMIIYFVFLRNM